MNSLQEIGTKVSTILYDPEIRKIFKTDCHQALRRFAEEGIDLAIPSGSQVKVWENTANTFYIPMPDLSSASKELDLEALSVLHAAGRDTLGIFSFTQVVLYLAFTTNIP